MNLVYGVVLSIWVAVLGNAGDSKGFIGPLQVAGVAAGTTVLVVGGAAIIAYGTYAWLGQSMAASDACGNVHVGHGRARKDVKPAAQPVPAPETQVPAPTELPAPETEAPVTTEQPPAQP